MAIRKVNICWISAILAAVLSFVPAMAFADSHVVFDSPEPGQVFAPGDSVSVILHVQPPLKDKITSVLLVSGTGEMHATKADPDKLFRWKIAIPQSYAGPFTLSPVLMGEDPEHPGQPLEVEDTSLTVTVVPKEQPLSLRMTNQNYHLAWPPSRVKEQLFVKGVYAGGERDLTQSAGTLWRSSATAVASVDEKGVVKIAGPGIAVITAENHGVKGFANFVIEDPAHPVPPQDVTEQVKIEKSPLRIDPEGKAYNQFPLTAQTVTITNTSGLPISGPLYLTVSDLSKDIWLWQKPRNLPKDPLPNMILYQRVQPQAGKPLAIRLKLKAGSRLNPEETVIVPLFFQINKAGIKPEYTLAVLHGLR
jgi:hypothetical protein